MAPVYIRKISLWDYNEGYKRPSEPLYSSSLILQNNFRQQQKLAYRYDQLRDIAIDVKSGLLAQMRKFKEIGQYGELISFPLQLLLPTQLLRSSLYVCHYRILLFTETHLHCLVEVWRGNVLYLKKVFPAPETNRRSALAIWSWMRLLKIYLFCFLSLSDCRSESSIVSVAHFDALCAFERYRLLLEYHPCCSKRELC